MAKQLIDIRYLKHQNYLEEKSTPKKMSAIKYVSLLTNFWTQIKIRS